MDLESKQIFPGLLICCLVGLCSELNFYGLEGVFALLA